MSWWPLMGLGALALWTKSAGAATAITKAALRKAGTLAVFPVEGGKLSKKPSRAYLNQRTATHKHRGVDIMAAEGTPVLAPYAGTVAHTNRVWVKGFGGYGRTVVLEVPYRGRTFYMLFAHLEGVNVRKGKKVNAGDELGTVGKTEFTNEDHTSMGKAPHLHFELAERRYPMKREAERLDPTPLLKAAQSSPFSL